MHLSNPLFLISQLFFCLSPCSKFPPVNRVIIYFCFSKSYSYFSPLPLYYFAPSLQLRSRILPYLCVFMLNILLHLEPLLSLPLSFLFASCLFLSFSRSLAGPLLFIWHPSLLPLLLCTHFRLRYLCLHIKSLFTFILNHPPSYLLLVIKLPVDFCLTCRIFALLETVRDG